MTLRDALLKISDPKTFIYYSCVGASAAIVNFSVLALCLQIFTLGAKVSISIAFVMSVLTHFTLNRRVTFKSHKEKFHGQIARYIVMTAINYSITLTVAYVVIDALHYSPYISA